MSRIHVTVREDVTRAPLAFRAYLTDSNGRTYWPIGPHVAFDCREEVHFLAEGGFEADIPPGTVSLRIERGPEYVPFAETLELPDGEIVERSVTLTRWVEMNARGWYSGDLHVHRRPSDMALAVRAEGLNLGTNITTHNKASLENLPDDARVRLDENTAYSTLDAEIERLYDGSGATVLLGLREPLDFGEFDDLYPPDIHFADRAREQGGHIDAEKPFWKGTPVNVALGIVDSMGVVPNHFHRQKVVRESARWGAIPQETQFVGDAGFARWILDLYYRYLNCGVRLPASGGSASGIMPSPIGYCRTYVKLADGFDYDDWFTALRNGRSFATNGPMLFLTVNGEDPGGLLRFPIGSPVTVHAHTVALSGTSLDSIELIRDGAVIARVESDADRSAAQLSIETDVVFRRSGWIAARTFERIEGNVRYAQTSPVYVFMGTDPIASAEDGRYFRGIVEERIAQAMEWRGFRKESHRQELIALLQSAREVYEQVIARALERDSAP